VILAGARARADQGITLWVLDTRERVDQDAYV